MSDHIADANKMVSDTPRTDDQECDMFVGVSTFTPSDIQQAFDFARTLERELNRACEMYRKLDIHALNLVDRIRRLEEAGDAMMSEPCEYTFEQWIKAKEAKP